MFKIANLHSVTGVFLFDAGEDVFSSINGDCIKNEPALRINLNNLTNTYGFSGEIYWTRLNELSELSKEHEDSCPDVEISKLSEVILEEKEAVINTLEKSREVKDMIENLDYEKLENKDCFVVPHKDKVRLRNKSISSYEYPMVGETDTPDKEIVFSGFSVSFQDVVEGSFDFRDYVSCGCEVNGRCCHCHSRITFSGSSQNYIHEIFCNNSVQELEQEICTDCVNKVTMICADISGDEKLKKEVMAESI